VVLTVVNVVGTSKVAFCICKILFANSEFEPGFVVSRDIRRANWFVKNLRCGLPTTYEELSELSGIVFVAVPDAVIERVFSKIKPRMTGRVCVFHFSGFLSSSIFDVDDLDWGRGSIHPNMSFSDIDVALKSMERCFFGIEGNDYGMTVARKIVNSISEKFIELDENSKTAYHLAAVIASNFVTGLSHLAERLYSEYKIDRFRDIIPQLIRQTAENISKVGSVKALTGPVSRGDWNVVEKEGQIFKQNFTEYSQLYDVMIDILREMVYESNRKENKRNGGF